jgi:endonuclease/exonuclease/phosphatase (EEP) superfamily protein YafD
LYPKLNTVILLILFSVLFLFATFIPLVKLDHWWIRVFDYPRLQKLIILLILIVLWWCLGESQRETWIWIGILTVGVIYLGFLVWPYTPLGKKMIRQVPFDKEKGIHLIISNVYQFNKEYEKLLNLVQEKKPDVVFLVETNQKWLEQLQTLESEYPYSILIPKENTYGLAFYSKFPVKRQEINYLIDQDVPSLEVDLCLDSGDTLTIYGIHPTPPVPGENSKSTERDAEILIVGKKSKSNPNPSLVLGDLNDVAWSYTTSLFLKISEMADPRRGRGFFSTFHAKVPIFRWPLDHVFLSKHFGLSKIKVLPTIGSDHFPIELKATLTPMKTTQSESANQEEKIEARAKIINGLKE